MGKKDEDYDEDSEDDDLEEDQSEEEQYDESDSDTKKSTKRKAGTKKKLPPKKRANTGKVAKNTEPISFSFKNPEYLKKKSKNKKRMHKNLKQIITQENYQDLPPTVPTYINIEAPPSMYPPKKYCDITGLHSKYTAPNGIRYHSSVVYPIVTSLNEYRVQDYLGLRKSTTNIK
ncbi:INO80 complex subunit C [Acrasis kona]|uniref:INO80 complex subunit C n=1 Tax=Acrasis kona TaxID=1008807 RepID=A0AAW2YIM4_9EUKA